MKAKAFLKFSIFCAGISGAHITHAQNCGLTPGTPLPTSADNSFCSNDSRPEIRLFCPRLAKLQTAVNAGARDAALRDVLNKLELTQFVNTELIAEVAKYRSYRLRDNEITEALLAAGQVRTDQQFGSSSSASGTSSLITKAGSAELLAFAVDSGALTRSIDGSTSTLSANADHLYRLVTGNDPDHILDCTDNGVLEGQVERYLLNRLNFSASFALAQASNSSTPTSGQASGAEPVGITTASIPTGAGKLTSISARYQMPNKFDPRGDAFRQAWQKQIPAVTPAAIKLFNAIEALFASMSNNATFRSFQLDRQSLEKAAIEDSSGHELIDEFEKAWKEAGIDQALDNAAADVVIQDRDLYRQAWAKAVADATGTMLTVQYSFNKPANQPQTHDFTLVYGYAFGQRGSLTFNGAASIYHGTLPADARYGRIHYGQVSAEYDRNLRNPDSKYQPQLSLAGYWQYQPEASILNIPAGTVAPGTTIPLPKGTQEFVGTAGSLWVTQAKITIKSTGGIQVPIGVSWSNKTDLLQGSKVGAQVGISYNFASLAGLF